MPPTKSMSPSRNAWYARSTGKISSAETSIPSRAKNPSSAAASAGKYEFEIRSGIASRIAAPPASAVHRRCGQPIVGRGGRKPDWQI
jgi:hypothetical protein